MALLLTQVSHALLKENPSGYNNREHNIFNAHFHGKFCTPDYHQRIQDEQTAHIERYQQEGFKDSNMSTSSNGSDARMSTGSYTGQGNNANITIDLNQISHHGLQNAVNAHQNPSVAHLPQFDPVRFIDPKAAKIADLEHDLIERMLQFNPDKRISVSQALASHPLFRVMHQSKTKVEI